MIMTGMSRRTPGLPGRLVLLAVAGALLPLGATWAQAPAEAKDDQVEPARVRVHTGDLTIVSSDVKLGGEGKIMFLGDTQVAPRATTIELSGPPDDVIVKLEQLIADLKKNPEASGAGRLQVEELEKFRDDLKQKKRQNGDGRRIVVESMKLDVAQAPAAEKQAEITKARQEVFNLRASLEANLKKLEATQARIRELGGDPGDVPVIRWQRTAKQPQPGVRVQQYTIMKPVTTTTTRPVHVLRVEPAEKSETVTTTTSRPVHAVRVEPAEKSETVTTMTTKPVDVLRIVPAEASETVTTTTSRPVHAADVKDRVRSSTDAPDAQRIDQLEKRLKDLQDEVERMKNSAGPAGAGSK